MTDSAIALIGQCEQLGILLSVDADGMLAVDAPKGTLTPQRCESLKSHKIEIIRELKKRPLRKRPQKPQKYPEGSKTDFSIPEMRPQKPQKPSIIDPQDVLACPNCRSYELWQNPLGSWRCLSCDPPHTARSLLAKAEAIRNPERNTTR